MESRLAAHQAYPPSSHLPSIAHPLMPDQIRPRSSSASAHRTCVCPIRPTVPPPSAPMDPTPCDLASTAVFGRHQTTCHIEPFPAAPAAVRPAPCSAATVTLRPSRRPRTRVVLVTVTSRLSLPVGPDQATTNIELAWIWPSPCPLGLGSRPFHLCRSITALAVLNCPSVITTAVARNPGKRALPPSPSTCRRISNT